MTDHAKINALCEKLRQAHYDKDASAIVDCYAPDALIFNLAPPLSSNGVDRDATAEWLDSWQGPVALDTANVDVTVCGALAIVAGLNRMRGRKTNGEVEDIWYRSTACLRRVDSDWIIVHEHTSTPFYMDGSLKAAVDLAPDP